MPVAAFWALFAVVAVGLYLVARALERIEEKVDELTRRLSGGED